MTPEDTLSLSISSSLSKIQLSLETLRDHLKIIDSYNADQFSIHIIEDWLDINKRLDNIHAEGLEDELLVIDRDLERHDIDIKNYLIQKIDFFIKNIDGPETREYVQSWLDNLAHFSQREEQKYRKRFDERFQIWKLQDDYSKVEEKYNNFLSKIETGAYKTERQKLADVDVLINNIGKLQGDIDPIIHQSENEIDGIENISESLQEWKGHLDEIKLRLREGILDLPTVFQNKDLGKQLQLIRNAKSKQADANYFISDEFDQTLGDFVDNSREEMKPGKAESICISRWKKFSEYKYDQYISQALSMLGKGNNGPFNKDPREVKSYLDQKIAGTLMGFFDLGDEGVMERRYNTLYEKIDKATLLVGNLETRLYEVQDSANEDSILTWRNLITIKSEVDKSAPCLLEKYHNIRDDLLLVIVNKIQREERAILKDFQIDLADAKAHSEILKNELIGLEDFKEQYLRVEEREKFTSHVINVISDIKQLEPDQAALEIKNLITEIEKGNYPMPEAVSDLKSRIDISKKPLLNAKKLQEKLQTKIFSIIPEETDFDRSELLAFKEQLGVLIDELEKINTTNQKITKLQDWLKTIKDSQQKVESINSYLLARDELLKENADLGLVGTEIKLAQRFGELKKYLPDLQEKLESLSAGDTEVVKGIKQAEKILSSTSAGKDKALFTVYNRLSNLENRPSTQKNELLRIRKKILVEIQTRLEDFLDTFINNTTPEDLKKALLFQQKLVQIFPDHELIPQSRNAISIAEAIQAENKLDWKTAYFGWKRVSDYTDKEGRALACLKLWAMTEATGGQFGTLINRALSEATLQSDPQIICFDALREFEEVKKIYEDPRNFAELGGVEEFNRVINRLSFLLGTNPMGNEKNQKEGNQKESEVSLILNDFLLTWQRYNYDTYLENEIVNPPPPAPIIQQDVEQHREIYEKIISISELISLDTTLNNYLQGKHLVSQIIDNNSFGDPGDQENQKENTRKFKEIWSEYRDYIVQELQKQK